MDSIEKKEIHVDDLFEQYLREDSCLSILSTFKELCDILGLSNETNKRVLYDRFTSTITSRRAQCVWELLNKRRSLEVYQNGTACEDMKVLVIGAGPTGLRTAIEAALLGCRVVVIEKRDIFCRNNTLHLWPFLITDLKNLAAKECFPKFCVGNINHISIRQLQCILLKVALILGIEFHVNVRFDDLVEPTKEQDVGWKCKTCPKDHVVSEFEFDVVIGAEGKGTTLQGFTRKEYRAKLAIAITINYVRKYTREEAKVQEMGGLIQFGSPSFFKEMKDRFDIDLENVVYFKGETHYFVMTAKKQSLLKKGVLKSDKSNAVELLSRSNVDNIALLNYADEVAKFSTKYELPSLEYSVNHKGEPDVAMFDFSSMYYSENSSCIIDRHGKKLLLALIGDSLLEPFWPQGTGCARGFLGGLDAAWMIRQWASGKMTPLEVIAERETIYKQLASSHPFMLKQKFDEYTTDPVTRYKNYKILMNKRLSTDQVKCYYYDEECESCDAPDKT